MGVEVAPSQLHVIPILVTGGPVKHILVLEECQASKENRRGKQLTSETNEGLEMFHLYAEKSKMSAHDLIETLTPRWTANG